MLLPESLEYYIFNAPKNTQGLNEVLLDGMPHRKSKVPYTISSFLNYSNRMECWIISCLTVKYRDLLMLWDDPDNSNYFRINSYIRKDRIRGISLYGRRVEKEFINKMIEQEYLQIAENYHFIGKDYGFF